MKWLISCTVLVSILISSPSYSINLDSSKMITNIIKSLDEERDRWIIREDSIYYINRKITKNDREKSWPEHLDDCLVYLHFSIMRPKPYVAMKLPIDGFIEDKRLYSKLRQVVYEELHNRYGMRIPKKKVFVPEKREVKKKVEKKSQTGMKKITY